MARPVTETDRAIIRLLQGDARVSYAEISRETGIPESTVRRRMERLQARGVIRFAVVADPARLGYDVQATVGLRIDLRRLDAVAAALAGMREVSFAAVVTGTFDLMAHVVARTQGDLVTFLSEQVAAVDGVRAVETFVMPRIVKPITDWVLPESSPEALAAELERGPDAELDGDDEPAHLRRRARLRQATDDGQVAVQRTKRATRQATADEA